MKVEIINFDNIVLHINLEELQSIKEALECDGSAPMLAIAEKIPTIN